MANANHDVIASACNAWKPPHPILVGIIGGIGPAASALLYQNVISLNASAKRDMDHVPLLIYNNPQIPNNNEAVLGVGPSPVPAMAYSARALERAGATHVAVPCNTAHVFVEEIRRSIYPMEFLDMLELTAIEVRKKLLASKANFGGSTMPWKRDEISTHRVGLLGTDGTIRSKVFHRAFAKVEDGVDGERMEKSTIKIIAPKEASQRIIQQCILRIKAGECEEVRPLLLQEAKNMIRRDGVESIVLGCTELPVVLTPEVTKLEFGNVPAIDPMRVLALEIIGLHERSRAENRIGK